MVACRQIRGVVANKAFDPWLADKEFIGPAAIEIKKATVAMTVAFSVSGSEKVTLGLLSAHKLDASILRASLGCVIGCNRILLAQAHRFQPGGLDAVGNKILQHRVGATFR